MHPSSILSYYPNYSILDEILSYSDYDSLNIFMDLKNNLQSLYMEHTIRNIIEQSSNYVDTSVFTSVLSFLSWHKLYAAKRGIKIKFYIFFEKGISYYHKNISKKYKISRKIDDLYGLDKEKRDLFFTVYHKNLTLIEKALNVIPFVKVFGIPHLEADFLPYYLMTRNLVDTSPNIANITYSNDHDLLQNIFDNSFIFYKQMSNKKIIKSGEVMKSFFKNDNNFPDSYLPLAMSIIGDAGDDVDGIKQIGFKRLDSILEEVITMTGGVDQIYDNIQNDRLIFSDKHVTHENKYIRKILENEKLVIQSMKLVSFELLSRWLDNPKSTEIIEKKKFITNILDNNEVVKLDQLYNALTKNRVFVEKEDLNSLYFGYGG